MCWLAPKTRRPARRNSRADGHMAAKSAGRRGNRACHCAARRLHREHRAMASLLDQSALISLAERLVAAARRAGADASDAVAVRSVSLGVEVRDGHVEETERAESDDLGLRVLVGRRQAVVSSNDVKGNGADALAERAVAMARVAPEDPFAGLADESLLAHQFPDLDLIDPALPEVTVLER